MTRDEFVERQSWAADRKLALTNGEEDAREHFRQLAIATYDFLISTGADFVLAFDPSPESAGNALRGPGWGKRGTGDRVKLSPALIQRWELWNREYFEVRERNPQLELRDLMQDISESHTASSWPAGYERHIQTWVDAGDPSAPPPFVDHYGTITPEFFQRLRELRQQCGGWLYSNDHLKRVVFAPESEWQRVRAEQEASEAKWRRDWEESRIRSETKAKQLQDVLTAARADVAFWEALKCWELAREAKRPPKPPTSEPSSRPTIGTSITFRQASPEEREEWDNPPVDQIFTDFIARVREPDGGLTVHDILVSLRAEMRRELGLDNFLSWSGGPGLGLA